MLGLQVGTAYSQAYISFAFTNTLASSSGSASLLGIGLDQNTIVQGVFTCTLYNEGSQIQLNLSNGINSVNENTTGFQSGFVYSQDLVNNTLIFSSSSTPWGSLFRDEVYLPPGVMSPDINTTLLNVLGGGKWGPGLSYDQYYSVVTISDGTTTGIFGTSPIPEPGTLALCAIGGLGFLVVRIAWPRPVSETSLR